MSDTLRTYGGRKAASHSGGRSVLSLVRSVLTVVVLLLLGYGCWSTRDSVALQRLIPAGQKYNVTAFDLLNKRGKIANAPVWKALPESMGISRVPELLTHTLGLPDWVFNNLIGDQCQLSGNDVRAFSDAVLATRMRPIGVVLERFHWLAPGVERDAAGGLELRRLTGPGLYYAVRGRILLVSPSRPALIRAVTLREQDSLAATPVSTDTSAESGAEDLRGSVALAPDDPLGGVFSTIRFAAKIDSPDTLIKCRAVLNPAARQRFAFALEHAAPGRLLAPPAGMVELSGNFGEPVHDLVTGLGEAFQWPAVSAAAWERWEAGPEAGSDATPRLAQMLTRVAGDTGPSFRLSLYDVDLNEILPVPEIVAVFGANGHDLGQLLQKAALPAAANAQAWESYARYDEETKSLEMPLPAGGPSMTPTALAWGEDLLLSSSETLATKLAAAPPVNETLPQQGNLFVRVRPLACVQAVANAARLLADADALRGYTSDSLEAAVTQWTERAGIVQEVWGVASHQDGEISIDIGVKGVSAIN